VSKQLGINPEMDELAREHNLSNWSCVSLKSNTWWRRCDGIEHTYTGFRKTWIQELKDVDHEEPISKDWQQPTLVSFKKLSLGARFRYTKGSTRIYVKIGSDLIAVWDKNNIDTTFMEQGIFSFSDDGNTDIDVELME